MRGWRRRASCRTSSLSILYFRVHHRDSKVTTPLYWSRSTPIFRAPRRMKLRSKVLVASSEQTLATWTVGLQLSKMKFERQVLLRNEVLIAHRHQPLNQILELADVSRPPVISSASPSSCR